MLFSKKKIINFISTVLMATPFALAHASSTFILTPDSTTATVLQTATQTVYYTIYNNSPNNFPVVGVNNTFPTEIAEAQPVLDANTTCPSLTFPLNSHTSCKLGFEITGKQPGEYIFMPEICEYTTGKPIYCSQPSTSSNQIAVTVNPIWQGFAPGDSYVQSLVEMDGQIYAGTNANGVYVEVEPGVWDVVIDAIPGNGNVTSMVIKSGQLYVGTKGTGVFTLEAEQWKPVGTNAPGNSVVTSLLVDVTGTLYAGTTGTGVQQLGVNNTWQPIGGLPGNGNVTSLLQMNDVVYASTTNNVYQLTVSGWISAAGNLPGNGNVTSLSALDGVVYAATLGTGVYRLSSTWLPVGTLPADGTTLMFDHADNQLYAGTVNGVYQLEPGDIWQMTGTAVPGNGQVLSLLVSEENELYAGTAGTGIWGTVDTKTAQIWVPFSSVPGNGIVSCLLNVQGILYAGTSGTDASPGGVYALEKDRWVLIGDQIGSFDVVALAEMNNALYVGVIEKAVSYLTSKVYRLGTTDSTWKPTGPGDGDPTAPTAGKRLASLAALDGILYAGFLNYVLYQLNADNTWTLSTPQMSFGNSLSLVVVDNTLYAAKNNFTVGNAVFALKNNRWEQIGNYFPVNSIISSLTGTSSENLYAATKQDGAFKLINNVWQRVGNGLPGDGQTTSLLYPGNGKLYAGTVTSGVFELENNNWRQIGGLPQWQGSVSAMATVGNQLNDLYVGSPNNSVWFLDLAAQQ